MYYYNTFIYIVYIGVIKIGHQGTSLAVQWLSLRASNTGGAGLIPAWGTKILHAA